MEGEGEKQGETAAARIGARQAKENAGVGAPRRCPPQPADSQRTFNSRLTNIGSARSGSVNHLYYACTLHLQMLKPFHRLPLVVDALKVEQLRVAPQPRRRKVHIRVARQQLLPAPVAKVLLALRARHLTHAVSPAK